MGYVRVWWSEADAPEAAEVLLSGAERERLFRFERQVDRERFRSAHALVRVLVSELADVGADQVVVAQTCDRCGEAHGRPTVTVEGRPGPPVSLSHAGGLVVAAVAAAPVGVDLEPLGALHEGVAQVALSAAEQAQLAALPSAEQPDALTRWWVRKEAVLKATGLGLRVDPAHVEVSPPRERPKLVGWRGDGRPRSVRMSDLNIDTSHAATVAVVTRRLVRVWVTHNPLSRVEW